MNIFYLDQKPWLAAQYHNDRHVVKMVLETAQLLSAAHHILDRDTPICQNVYKLTHKNHPCAVWVRASYQNYMWTYQLLQYLLAEYTFRYGKEHKTSRLMDYLQHIPNNIPPVPFTPVALAMPDELKLPNPVDAYRNYYRQGKAHLAKWTKRETPSWW